MRAELQIMWDGDGPGLAEHRLSVSALSAPLANLLSAVRGIASNLLNDAATSERGAKGGRFSRLAEGIDLQLSIVDEGCLRLSADVIFPDTLALDGQIDLFPSIEDVAGRTLTELVEAIDAESKGQARSAVVRKFLKSMNGIVTSHSYSASLGGKIIAEAQVGVPQIIADPISGTYMVQYRGHVSGLIFAPRPEIRIRADNQTYRISAPIEAVNRALELRGGDVVLHATRCGAGRANFLYIRPASDEAPRPDADERRRHLTSRWGDVLMRLGQ